MSIQTNAGFLDNVPVGCAMDWFTDTAPTNWMLCRGQAISRTTYSKLFAILGTTYGIGDGSTTFNLPDFRGKTAVGKSASGTFGTIGQSVGNETTTLSVANLPSHTHGITDPKHGHGITDPGHTHVYSAAFATSANDFDETLTGGGTALKSLIQNVTGTERSTTGISVQMSSTNIGIQMSSTGITVKSTGSGTPINNIQPSLVCNKIIKVL